MTYTDEMDLWDLGEGRCIKTLTIDDGYFYCVKALPDGRVGTGSSRGTIDVWDIAEGRCVQQLDGHMGAVRDLAVVKDGGILVSVSNDSTLKTWILAEGRCVHTLTDRDAPRQLTCVAVLSGGRRAVSGDNVGRLKAWDLTEGRLLLDVNASTQVIRCLSALREGRVASGSNDCSVMIWDMNGPNDGRPRCLQTLTGASSVSCLHAFAGYLAFGSCDGSTTILFDEQLADEKRTAKAVARQRACEDVVKVIDKFL